MSADIPQRGTREFEWWHKGALAEAAARREGRTKQGLEILDAVEVLTEQDRRGRDMSGVDIGLWLLGVFSAPRTLRARLRLTWRVWRRLR